MDSIIVFSMKFSIEPEPEAVTDCLTQQGALGVGDSDFVALATAADPVPVFDEPADRAVAFGNDLALDFQLVVVELSLQPVCVFRAFATNASRTVTQTRPSRVCLFPAWIDGPAHHELPPTNYSYKPLRISREQ